MPRSIFSITNVLGIFLSAVFLSSVFLSSVVALAQTSAPESSQHTRSLKQAIGNRYKIGVGVSHRVLQNPADAALIREQFEIITPENCMKPQSIHPAENQWRFDAPDRFVEFAKQNQLEVVGHCLVWAKDDRTDAWMMEENGQPVSRETLLKRIENHVATVVQRYADTATMWDVVNEALGDGDDALLRDSIYFRTTDLDFIATAFRTARKHDPTALLIYNDYNCHKPEKREKLIELLTKLKEQNVPVDAYGMQGHFELGDDSLPQLRETFDELRKLGMKVVVSELDIDVVTRGRWWAEEGKFREELSTFDPYRDGLPAEIEQQQTQQYVELFKLFDEYQDMIVRVSFWNLHDGQSWLNYFPWNRTNHPLLFDRNRQPKPAFDAVYNLLRQTAAKPEKAAVAAQQWAADNGNGTYSNPLFYEEFEDPDVLRVGEDYYLAGTTMHMNPGVQLMHSKDLVNWELVGYCVDRLDYGPAFRLENGNIYGQGVWAPCLRYHNGTFYVFTNINGLGLQVFRSKSIEGPWERNQLPGRHDMSVLFDDDGKVYIISGAHSPYPIEELTPDLRAFVPGVRHELVGQMGEGHHLYKINGKYVDVSAIPGGPVDQMVAVADSIDGPWEVERMVQGESLGVTAAAPDHAQPSDRGLWLHQGGIVDTPSGQWWSVIMSDHGSAGRMVSLVPVTWNDGFPLIGLPGNLRKAPNTWVKPDTGYLQEPKPAFIHDDDFNSTKLNPHWQWNHVPDDHKWSITEKPGVLRLHSLPAAEFYSARNSLCQRPPGPESIMTVEIDTSGLVEGDTAGLALLSSPYAWIGVVKTADGTRLQTFESSSRRGGRRGDPAASNGSATEVSVDPPSHLWLRVHCNFDKDQAVFSWSADGKEFTPLGGPFTMTFQLRTFQGVRPALFNFNTSGQPGGYADFDNYSVKEPRAMGIERTIPLGKTITLTSGADGSFLAADSKGNTLINISADSADANQESIRFEVVDLGLGRVALKAANGRFVSANSSGVVLKDLANAKPDDAESFQWINLMRGDTMLMSLVNHRYLNTTPKQLGRVDVSARGPRPDRKGGACFQWQELNSQLPTKAADDVPVPGSNPIIRDVFTADPAPLVVDDTVYLYVGHDKAKDGEMFTMPEWLCYSSDDMKHWTDHGAVLRPTDFRWGEPNSAWASQVVSNGGKFYYYVTVKGNQTAPGNNIGVAVSDSPIGPFKDAIGKPLVRDNMTPKGKRPWEDIDPTVWIDEDGTPWMSWGNGDCYFVKLKPNMIELDGTIEKIELPHYVEGPWLFERDGLYYLVYAAIEPPIGSEQIAYATAETITGPWSYRGMITGPAKNSFTIHPGIIEFKGQWYFFYHFAGLTIDGQRGALGRRAVCVEYLHFNADGTIKPITQTKEGVSVGSKE